MSGTLASLQELSAHIQRESAEVVEGMRAKRVRDLRLMEREFNKTYEDLVLIAAKVCGTPNAMITIIDATTLKITTFVGPDVVRNDERELPREDTMCDLAIQHPYEVMVVHEAETDSRTQALPGPRGHLIRFYAGAPLTTSDGLALGSICVVDRNETHNFSDEQRMVLSGLARLTTLLLTRVSDW